MRLVSVGAPLDHEARGGPASNDGRERVPVRGAVRGGDCPSRGAFPVDCDGPQVRPERTVRDRGAQLM